jgi:serine/threonine protein kinase/tetratricopeptide (TPR) repeat protein
MNADQRLGIRVRPCAAMVKHRSRTMHENDPPPGTAHHIPDGDVGAVIAGRYKLLEAIGDGGMGTVWMAEQRKPVKRLVALKLIKPGMDSGALLARFEAERQALALMDHSHIAKILDGGTTANGHPYFVMELVKGLPLIEYCDERRLSVQDRLQLFVQICSAVQHAHQKGIIHRDLKPSNILVTEHDGKPVPKVIDFGLAMALGASALTEHTLHTAYGTVVGTPLYMAPEQVGINALDVDTRSDIYALGAILYELLTGSTPLEKQRLKEAAWDEIRRLIREEEPARPSLRLSSSDALPALAARRQTEPAKLSRLVKGDLDWIVLKALEKDRNRRYETANGLALDVQRHLGGETVLAAPPSVRYRLGKFLRKRRGPALAAAVVLLVLVTGIAGTSWGLVEAMHQRDAADDARAADVKQRKFAEENAKRAAAAAREEAQQRQIADANAKKATKAAEEESKAKDHEAEQRNAAVAAQERAMEALRATTDEVIDQLLGSRPVFGLAEKAFLEVTLKRWQVFAAEKGESPEARAIRAEGLVRVGWLRHKLGQHHPALADFQQATALWDKLVAEFPTVPLYRRELALTQSNLGIILDHLGRRAEAEEHHRQALAWQQQLTAEFPAIPGYQYELAHTHNRLAVVFVALGNDQEAEEHFRVALRLWQKLAAEFPNAPRYRQSLAVSHNNLGNLLKHLRKRPEAEEQYRLAMAEQKKLVAEFPEVPNYRHELAGSHNNLGELLRTKGRNPEAEEHFGMAVALRKKLATEFPAIPEYRQDLAESHYSLGALLRDNGKNAEAEEQYRLGLGVQEKLAGEFPAIPTYRRDLAVSHNNLGIWLHGLGKQAQAGEHYRQALDLREKLAAEFPAVPGYQVDLAGIFVNIGNLTRDIGKPADSLEWYTKAIASLAVVLKQDPALARACEFLHNAHNANGRALAQLGRGPEAEEAYRQALDVQEKLVADFPADPAHRQALGRSHFTLAVLLHGSKRAEAEEHYRRALDLLQKLAAEFPGGSVYRRELGGVHNNLGILLDSLGKRAEAEEHYRAALGLREKLAAELSDVASQIDLGGTLVNSGNLVRDNGKPADSLEWYTKAIATLAAVLKKEPGQATARQFLRNAHWGRARALDQLGRHEEAVKDLDQAVALTPPAQQGSFKARRALSQAKAGQVAQAVAEVAALTTTGKWPSAAWYDFARVYAVASAKDKDKQEEYATRAVELLQRAVKAGYNDVEKLKNEPDLDALRGREGFQLLLQSLAPKKDPR